jgi:hypothetical protein
MTLSDKNVNSIIPLQRDYKASKISLHVRPWRRGLPQGGKGRHCYTLLLYYEILNIYNMDFNLVDILFLPAIFFIGAIVSYEDIKFNKIKNKWILASILYGLFIFGILIILTQIDNISSSINFNFQIRIVYFLRIFINSIITLIIGFFLYRSGTLAAGDAKLIFIFSFLLPLKYYWKSYLPVFPSLVLFLNIFIPIFIYIILRSAIYAINSLVKIYKKPKQIDLKMINKKVIKGSVKIFKILVGIILILIALNKINQAGILPIALSKNNALIFLLIFLLYRQLGTLLKDKKIFFFAIIAVLSYFGYVLLITPEYGIGHIFGTLSRAVIFVVSINIIQALLDYYFKTTTIKELSVKNLAPGMVFASEKQVSIFLGRQKGGGINIHEVEHTQKLAKEKGTKTIQVYSSHSFAVWIFVGVLITIILQGSILSLFM